MKILLLAIRSLFRFRLYTWINILGLALSITCVVIIGRYLFSEWSTDHLHKNLERIYFTTRSYPESADQRTRFMSTDNVLFKSNYVDLLDLPEVAKQASFVSLPDVTLEVEEKKFSAHVYATDTMFLQVFEFPLIEGDRSRLLADPQEAVITWSYAKKLFGDESPIGKPLQYNEHLLTVKGVIGEFPTASSLSFDLLVSKGLQWRWPPYNVYTAALMNPAVDIRKVNEKLLSANPDAEMLFQLFPFNRIYLDTTIENRENTFRQGNKSSLQVLSLVSLLILIVGMVNFIQICSVILLKRERELGLKKIFGAQPFQLFGQLYLENILLMMIALVVGWSLIELTQPLQTHILGVQIVNNRIFNIGLSLSLLLGLPLVTTLYPFYQYVYQQSVKSLKPVKGRERLGVRSLFLIVQYSITICLIVSALFFVKQLNYMLQAEPGYRTKGIVKAWFQHPSSQMQYANEEVERLENQRKYILETIKSSPLFTACCYGRSPYEFVNDQFSRVKARVPGGEWIDVYFVKVEANYFDLYQIPVSVGNSSLTSGEILMNETAKRLFPNTASLETNWNMLTEQTFMVKGYTPDFQIAHLSYHNKPVILTVEEPNVFFPGKLMAAIVPGREQEAIQLLKKLHNETVGGDFKYSFVADEMREIYQKDKQVSRIYSFFAVIAILISSLGLFCLSLFDIQRRYKEIAIRRINGATTSVILRMLLSNYYKLLLIAMVISIPVVWLAINRYLENFAHRTTLSWWLFIVALLITVSIALFTLIWQIRKAANLNPAEAVKTE